MQYAAAANGWTRFVSMQPQVNLKPGITAPIVGAFTSVQHAVAALDVTSSTDEVAALDAPYVPHEVIGVAFAWRFTGRVPVLA